jgi:hypothetical protein
VISNYVIYHDARNDLMAKPRFYQEPQLFFE